MKKISFCLYLLLTPLLYAQYPLIHSLSSIGDGLFSQQQKETESWYLNEARGTPPPPLSIYRYLPDDGDSLIMLAASFNLPVDTLATINGFENIRDFSSSKELLVPSAPGLYINPSSKSSWMSALLQALEGIPYITIYLNNHEVRNEVRFYSGQRLPSDLKTRFVLPLFSPPLHNRVVTSPYGYRNHPVTGKWGLHTGADYRSSVGSPIFSCADGRVLSLGELEDYGKFIIIKHKNGFTSLYGHLDQILVEKNQNITEGSKIAESGNTGISTGPHLHFELRQNGNPVDPENLLLNDIE